MCSCLEMMFLFVNDMFLFWNNMFLFWNNTLIWKRNASLRKHCFCSGKICFCLEIICFWLELICSCLETDCCCQRINMFLAARPCPTRGSRNQSGNKLADAIWQSCLIHNLLAIWLTTIWQFAYNIAQSLICQFVRDTSNLAISSHPLPPPSKFTRLLPM